MQGSFFKRIDKPLLVLYAIFLIAGWICIYEASYVVGQTSIFDSSYRSGKQFIWIILSIVASSVILNTSKSFFYSWSYVIYTAIIILLIITLLIAPNIKGSHSWLVIGGLSIQPAEFAKFATSLALANYLSTQNSHNSSTLRQRILTSLLIIALPMSIIILQSEMGSALIFVSFVIMLYREGLSFYVILVGFLSIVIFILTIGFPSEGRLLFTHNIGQLASINILLLVSFLIYERYYNNNLKLKTIYLLIATLFVYIVVFLINYFTSVKINYTYASIFVIFLFVGYLIFEYARFPRKNYLLLAIFLILFVGYSFSVDIIFTKVLKPHQTIRIETLLGLKEDIKGAGWNTYQSKIAISSGQLCGKGFLKGTQTKLKFVPEQDTDFIFCTIAEEWGFAGSITIILLFLIFIYRLIYLSERQANVFARIYGYCVSGIFLFHIAINIGMVLGIMPIIGIPLPFFSYGGSSLLAFSILLFIFIKLDMNNKVNL